MRADIFTGNVIVNARVNKDTYVEMRKKLFEYDVTQSELIRGFIDMIVAGDKRALKVIDALVERKLNKELEKRGKEFGNLDAETLYGMITKKTGDDDEDDAQEAV